MQYSSDDTEVFDLSQIFIGREQQLYFFQIYLNRWKQIIINTKSDDPPLTASPSPNDKIQGLIVLLYGRGGFGKSTLLRRYRDFILKENQFPVPSRTTVSKVIDWEFAVEGKRSLFNPPAGQGLDATKVFEVLHDKLADALGKGSKQFKEYQAAAKAVNLAEKEARGVLEHLSSEGQYDWLRDLAIEAIRAAVQTCVPGSKIVLDNPYVKKGLDEVVKLTQEQISQVRAKLQDKLGTRFGDYLDPTSRLGLALGRDLAEFAKNFPLLIFFDTYEEIDAADNLLRIVMGAAGLRVGWVIAGRSNLWAGIEHAKRNLDMEYGYKEIVFPDRGLPLDFNVGGVGAFTSSDIKEFFDELCKGVHFEPTLPRVLDDGAKRILDVTLGIPLAVKIVAGLYIETADLDAITTETKEKREIVDKMVQRYLLHTRIDRSERAKLYGLALLRRADCPIGVAAALGLSSEEAKTSFSTTLSLLHRRYSFIFTEKEEPSLHEEVRHFLRLWLIERSQEPDILAVNERLKVTHEAALQQLEEHRQYFSLKERLRDEEWVDTYLDLTQQQYWLDPFEGVRYALPFMLAAATYYIEINKDVAEIGAFFKAHMRLPYKEWWEWATQCLTYIYRDRNGSYVNTIIDNVLSSSAKNSLIGLEKLAELIRQHRLTFPSPFQDCYAELEAILWWRLGEANKHKDRKKALDWYEKAIVRLEHEDALKAMVAKMYWDRATSFDEKRGAERLPLLNRAIVLKDDFVDAYSARGVTYYDLKEYERALADFHRAIELDPKEVLNYSNRGLTYLMLKNIERAKVDFMYRWELSQTYLFAPWMSEWTSMGKQRPGAEMAKCLEEIAAVDPKQYVAHICRGVALGLHSKLKQGLVELEQAISLESEEYAAYFWQGMFYAYMGRNTLSVEFIENSLALNLPPILLIPLYWLEKDRPVFFEQYARPLLERYDI